MGDSSGEHEGEFWVPTKTPFSIPVDEYAVKEATRKKMTYAVANRMPENIPLHRELVLLRDETARMLGWPNHFAYRTSDKMVRTPQTVQKLLSEVRAALEPIAQRSADELRDLKVEEAVANSKPADNIKLFTWDRAYFATKADQKRGFDEASMSEYFELRTTLQKLLDMYLHIFGVELDPVESATAMECNLIWHKDVLMFSAWIVDEPEPKFLGYAYLDFHPREGKFTHAGQYTLQRV